jgi:hypothetical protein
MKKVLIVLLVLNSLTLSMFAQKLSQSISGQVIDKQSQQSLPGATVYIPGTQPIIGTMTDEKGYFKLTNVPVGRINIVVTLLGYNNSGANNLILISGKELVANFELEEKVITTEEVVISSAKPKSRANNEMATVSARSFTVEETEKYAGSRGDVARMASNYAGVAFADDSRNDIIIRGNSPSGLLWKLDDIEIPNPNHFAENGTTGGPVGMLNNNVLKNSDFMISAFPAEYGNATSGVFDLKMRNGNTSKYEFTGQIGFNGFELGAEGPIDSTNNSSFLIFYRYSTLGVFDKMGVNFGTAGIPKYQDLTFKLNYPVSKGVITLMGIAGKSEIAMLDSKIKETETNLYSYEGQDLYNRSSMAASGLSYTRFVDNNTYAKISLSGLFQNGGTDIDDLKIDTSYRTLEHDITEFRSTLALTLGKKYDAQLSTKTGVSVDLMGYNLDTKSYIDSLRAMYNVLKGSKNFSNGPQLIRSYYEAQYKINDRVIINPGVHFVYFTLSKQALLEPRVGLTWSYAHNRNINFGYGLHSRTHALSTYYLGTFISRNQLTQTNLNLDATRSHQFVIGHDWNISENLRLKTEAYYQYLFDVPVEQRSSSFSLLNTGSDWGVEADDSLVNNGTGYNKGIEITLEKFLSRGYYFLITTSIFESKYKGSDNIEHYTAFSGNYVTNALLGKEFSISSKSTLNIDIKVSYAGGKRVVPIDLEKSKLKNETVRDYSRAYDSQLPEYFKVDFKAGFRYNGRRITQEWIFTIDNLTDHNNVISQSFNEVKSWENSTDIAKHEYIKNNYQLGFFPMMQWRINF